MSRKVLSRKKILDNQNLDHFWERKYLNFLEISSKNATKSNMTSWRQLWRNGYDYDVMIAIMA